MTIINCTQHKLNVVLVGASDVHDAQQWMILEPRDPKAYAEVKQEAGYLLGEFEGLEIVAPSKNTEVVNLPAPVECVIYVVSGIVSSALAEFGIKREDVYVPDTGADSIRADFDGEYQNVKKGQIAAVRRLKRSC